MFAQRCQESIAQVYVLHYLMDFLDDSDPSTVQYLYIS